MATEALFDRHDREATLDFLEHVLALSTAQQTELVIEADRQSLTRFAGNQIHQNVSEFDCRLSIRAIENGCIGHSSTNKIDEDAISDALQWARDAAHLGNMKAEPAEFAGPQMYASLSNYSQRTADWPPRERATMVSHLVEKCEPKGASAAGAVSNSESVLAVANSNGLRAYHSLTDANFTATVSVNGSTGWCNCYSSDALTLQAARWGKRALGHAVIGRNPRPLEPGRYTVVLAEAAVKDLVELLCWLGLGAQALEEKRSFMCGKIGKRITGKNITLADDAFHPLGIGFPFDYEGIPKQRVVLIEKGTAKSVAYDRAYGSRAGKTSTGHAVPARYTFGPLPLNVVLSPGKSDYVEMLRSLKRGLLVTRFWYCRIVDPAKTLITGQTRDGTFLVEDGKIVCGVRDMRFNESILETFSRAEMISRYLRRIGSTIVPAMKIEDFRFTELVGEQ
ncbi:MAG: TldD/PmbA family protein [Candidatus Abyssobacteria bacterium SURF_17]|uniref:TldD/PmbA family protein n=1 Tax=Candidatus Abyssobacteria bacterium SURF_17 TaxID=2093361 RepID=A0A419F383_9BACT|nr:MAG: TldD/PmbA family protein [Candidatus Abyssubacteria bacterium SURF_17]